LKLSELAMAVGGEVVGADDIEIAAVATIDAAGPEDITFIANPKYLAKLNTTRAAAIIVAPGVSATGKNLLVCANPYLAYARIVAVLHVKAPQVRGVMAGAWVAPDAVLGTDVTICPGCYVGARVRIGARTILYPGVVLYDDVSLGEDCLLHAGAVVREACRLGDRVILQPQAVIGADGFGFAPDGARYYKIPQIGNVVVEDDVEVGAATCIDRGALGETRIGRGTKLDNLVQVGHNVRVGEDNILAGQAGVAGSTKTGVHCTFGGQVAVNGHITVGNNVTVAGRGGLTNDAADNQVLAGFPTMPIGDWRKSALIYTNLPELRKEIRGLKKRLELLEKNIEENK